MEGEARWRILQGRHFEKQLGGERARPGERRRRLRGADGRYGCRLRDRGLRVRVEEPESGHRGTEAEILGETNLRRFY